MARIRVEASEGTGGWTPVPDGTYRWRIEEVKAGQASSGTPSIGIVCEVTRGPAAGKKSTFWFYLTPKSGWRTRQLLDATGCPYQAVEKTEDGEVLDFDTDDLLNREFDAQIKIDEYESKLSNKIVKFVVEKDAAKPTSSAAPHPQAALFRSAAAPGAAAAPPKGAPPPRAQPPKG